ncbi:MAG: FecR family protein, partial [Akkermansiaceae bacterium]
MKDRTEKFDQELNHLLDQIRHDSALPEDVQKLERQLSESADLRARYRARMRMEQNLGDIFQSSEDAVIPFELPVEKPRGQHLFFKVAAVAAVIALGMFLLISGPLGGLGESPSGTESAKTPVAPTVESIAKLESTSEAAWGSPLKVGEGMELQPGVLQLKAGMVDIRFSSGALVSLEAPTEIKIVSPMKVELLSGRALVEVPDSAVGFEMLLPDGKIIDYGTRFSAIVNEGEASCEVLEGEVWLHHASTGEKKQLVDSQAVVMDQNGLRTLDFLPSKSFGSMQQNLPVLLRSVRENSVVVSNERSILLNRDMLLVKLEKGSKANRRSLFTIDLDDVDPKQIESGTLNLNLVPSGIGFSTYLPNMITFSVYGITDESKENWSDGNLLWHEAPGYVPDRPDLLDPNTTRLLGRIKVP